MCTYTQCTISIGICFNVNMCPQTYFSDNPPIIHVSLDGYRADYYKRMLNPNLQFVMDTGVRAEYMRSQYPTLTFPNHYTIMTVSGICDTSAVKHLQSDTLIIHNASITLFTFTTSFLV